MVDERGDANSSDSCDRGLASRLSAAGRTAAMTSPSRLRQRLRSAGACKRSVHDQKPRSSRPPQFIRRRLNSGASVRSVGKVLEQQRCAQLIAEYRGGKFSIAPWRFSSRAADTAPIPAMPGYPSAASPTNARKSGIKIGSTPNFLRTPSASRIVFVLRSICTMRSPRTHCARSLSGVQMQTFSTRSSSDAISRPRRARRRLPARSSARRRRPSRRALLRADGTERTARGRCPRRSCNPARARFETIR